MNYKTMLLSAFLLPVVATTNSKNSAKQIQELKDHRFTKELQLSELGKKIAEKDELLRSFRPSMINFIVSVMKEKHLNEQEEREEFGLEVDASIDNFKELLDKAFVSKKNIKCFFAENLFDEKGNKFDTLKFFIIRYHVELNLLKTLVELYGDCQQELFDINHKIDGLQQ